MARARPNNLWGFVDSISKLDKKQGTTDKEFRKQVAIDANYLLRDKPDDAPKD